MTHIQDGAIKGLVRIRGKTWDEPERPRRKRKNVIYTLFFKHLIDVIPSDWERNI